MVTGGVLKRIRPIFVLLIPALAIEHVWFYYHLQRDGDHQAACASIEDELAICADARLAERYEYEVAMALWEKRNKELAADIEKCQRELDDIERGTCVPQDAFDRLEKEILEWKRDLGRIAYERDACLRRVSASECISHH